MKQCNRCSESKPLDDFCVRSKSKDGRQPWCKECSTKRFKEYYRDDPKAYRDRAKKIQKEASDALTELKDNQPCMDCGVRYPYYVLEYDHCDPRTKEGNLKEMCSNGKATLLREVAKCDLVCANCHRLRTHKDLPTKWSR